MRSVNFFPLVGLIIGCVIWAVAKGALLVLAPTLAAVMALLAWVFVTGGLHLDGFMDLADGLGSNRSRERIMAIMKDSRVGAMGVLAAILLLMVKAASLYELITSHPLTLLLVPTTARLIQTFCIRTWPYITEKGLGTGLREGAKPLWIVVNTLLTGCLAWALGGWPNLVAILLMMVAGIWFAAAVAKKLGGLTGDVYGAIVEFSEAAGLLALLIMGRWL